MKIFSSSLLFSICLLMGKPSYSQQLTSPKDRLYPYLKRFENFGWFGGIGVTLTPKLNFISYDSPESLELSTGTAQNLSYAQSSQTGLYVEAGVYKLLKSRSLINYADATLAYKNIKGEQQAEGDINNQLINETSEFSHHAISLSGNVYKVKDFSSKLFIQNGLGINADYFLSSSHNYISNTSLPVLLNEKSENAKNLNIGLHYRFGVGFRISKKVFVIPNIEIPLLNIIPFEEFRSTIPNFQSRYRPLILSVRIAWLREPKCPKVWGDQPNDPYTR